MLNTLSHCTMFIILDRCGNVEWEWSSQAHPLGFTLHWIISCRPFPVDWQNFTTNNLSNWQLTSKLSCIILLPAELPAQEPWLPSKQAQARNGQSRSDPNCWSICLSCYSDEGTPLPRLYLSEIPKAAKYLHGRKDCLFHHSITIKVSVGHSSVTTTNFQPVIREL